MCIRDRLIFETRGLVGDNAPAFPRRVDNEFYCEEGVIGGGKFFPGGKGKGEPLVDVDSHRYPGNIFENFLNCVRSRKREEQHADILEGHLSSALCHMGNISHRLGAEAARDKIVERIHDADGMTECFERMQEHLLVNGVDVRQTPRILGPWLTLDPKTETFTGDLASQANALLRRDYREPFVLPENV